MNADILSDKDILLSNLSENDSQLSDILKKRRLYLRDLAQVAVRDDRLDLAASVTDADSETFNLYAERFDSENASRAQDSPFSRGAAMLTDIASVAALSYHMAREMKLPARAPYMPEGSRICYFRNRFSDRAYLSFEKAVKNASAFYAGDVASACEEVYFGRADYCVIPIESRADGIMPRFIGLIQKYELYIAGACKVTDEDGDFVTLCLLCASQVTAQDPDRLAITASPGGNYPIWKLLAAAELLGARLISYNDLPEKIASEHACYLVFDVRGTDIDALELCFQLTLPSWSEIGIYRQTETLLQ